jgi:signal transduction histidine kinase
MTLAYRLIEKPMTKTTQLQELKEERTKTLEESNSRFNVIFENSPLSIQILDSKGKTILVNTAWKQLWDLSDQFIEDYIYKKYNIFEDPILQENGVLQYLKRAWAGEIVKGPLFVYDPLKAGLKGRARVTRPLFHPLKDSHGQVQEVILIHEDITEQHEAVENKNFLSTLAGFLLESLEYEKTMEHIASACVPYLADGCLIDLIEHGEIKRLVTKHIEPEIQNKLWILHENFPITMNSPEPISRVLRSGRPELLAKVNRETIALHSYSEEHAELIESTNIKSHLAVPMKIRDETIGGLNFWITSERRPFDENDLKLAQEVSRYAALAIDNARLYRDAQNAIHQREDFISIASHELKTPVTALMLQMEIIQSILKETGPLDQKKLYEVCMGSAKQLNRLNILIEEMLDLTRISSRKLISEKKTAIGLKQLLLNVIERFSQQLEEENIKLVLSAPEELLVKCDPIRTEQVLTNILSNAVLYGKNNPIEITVESNAKAIISIKDYGIGIAPSDHIRIFNRFERVIQAIEGKGLGLGLFISKQIMEEQNGTIKLISELNKGSTFIIELPLAETSILAMTKNASPR